MKVLNRSYTNGGQAALVQELGIPAPFNLDTFGCWLEQHRKCKVRLIPMDMKPGSPSGVFLCRDGADCLYYEQQTSVYHQAHIILCLAARIVFGETTGPSVDLQLVPDVSPQLARLMLGELATSKVASAKAEEFAAQVLDQALPAVLARWEIRQLMPLRDALSHAVPQAANTVSDAGLAARAKLHRHVIETRDAMLALRPYRDPRIASAAITACRAAGIAQDDLAAVVEATVLAYAIHAKIAQQRPSSIGGGSSWLPVVGGGLACEAAWLGKVSQAFAQLSRRPRNRPGI